jgi:hypothetical protein
MISRRSKPVLILQWLLPFLLIFAAMAGYLGAERGLGILKPDQVINIDDFPGISGQAGCSAWDKSAADVPRPGWVRGSEAQPTLDFIEKNGGIPQRTLLLGAHSISSVIAGPQGELLLVSKENGLLMLDAQGAVVGKGWRPVSSRFIKGAALEPKLGLIVCEDRTPGKLLIFSSIKNWQDLLDAFKNRP